MAHMRIGISGWRYKPWRGRFYPDDLPQRAELEYAARQFPSIELNGSFYALQRPQTYARWREQTAPGFVFAVKAPRYITHTLRLRNIQTAMANFFASGVFELRDKLGPILWQFPPNMAFDHQRFARFLAMLPRDLGAARKLARHRDSHVKGRASLSIDRNRRVRHAVEVRHESFCDPAFITLLRRHGIALVVADTAGKWPLLEDVTAGFMYLRLHGDTELYASGYTKDALADWARRIRAWHRGAQPRGARRTSSAKPPARESRDIYCYFDNDSKVRAPPDARALMRRLRVEWSPATR